MRGLAVFRPNIRIHPLTVEVSRVYIKKQTACLQYGCTVFLQFLSHIFIVNLRKQKTTVYQTKLTDEWRIKLQLWQFICPSAHVLPSKHSDQINNNSFQRVEVKGQNTVTLWQCYFSRITELLWCAQAECVGAVTAGVWGQSTAALCSWKRVDSDREDEWRVRVQRWNGSTELWKAADEDFLWFYTLDIFQSSYPGHPAMSRQVSVSFIALESTLTGLSKRYTGIKPAALLLLDGQCNLLAIMAIREIQKLSNKLQVLFATSPWPSKING